MYNHNKSQQSKNRVHITWDILYAPVGGAYNVHQMLQVGHSSNSQLLVQNVLQIMRMDIFIPVFMWLYQSSQQFEETRLTLSSIA